MPLKDTAINQILPWAGEGLEADGDLVSLEEYAGEVMRKRGFRAGLARRALFNRVHRQTAHIAAGLAQYIANRYAKGVLDDANLDAIEEGLKAALGEDFITLDKLGGTPSTQAFGDAAFTGTSARVARSDHKHAMPEGVDSIPGNAGTATKLATARTIALSGDVTGSGSFDGSANISIAATGVQAAKLKTSRTINLSGKITGTATAFDGSANISIPVTAVAADSCTGNAGTATKLATARTIALSGDVTGSGSFDGSANISIAATGVQAAKLKTSRTIALSGKITGTATAFDGSANISIPVTAVTADSCTGNAGTATKLATARTVRTNLASADAASFDGTANILPGVTGILGLANGGTGAATAANARTALGVPYSQSLATNGWYKLPGGLIIQWGLYSAAAADTQYNVTLPVAYPSAHLGAWASNYYGGSIGDVVASGAIIVSTSQIGITWDGWYAPSNGRKVQWLSIGY